MEQEIETASSSQSQRGGENRGGGGKLRRPPLRKAPSTPYARPPSQGAGEQRRWLSKLVDPACRLISGGASLFFPSFFSTPPLSDADGDLEKLESETEAQQVSNGDNQNFTTNHEISRTPCVEGPSKAVDASESISDLVDQKQELKHDNAKELSKPVEKGFSDIEVLLQGKNFTRDEVNRLMTLINSRANEVRPVEQEKKDQSFSIREPKGPMISHEIIDSTSEKKQRDSHGSLWNASTPLHQSIMLDDIGASPIDIAKAYMGSRRESGNFSKGLIPKDNRSLLFGNDYASKSLVPSPSPKPSAYWPGSMVQDQHDYLTPQPQRGRYGIHNLPRTPYSRTIFSKSKTKVTQLQGDNDKWLQPSSSVQKMQTPVFGQEKSKSDAIEDDYASVGPIRRSRHKLGPQTPFTGSKFVGSSSVGPSNVKNSKYSQGFLPAVKKNFEPGPASSNGSQFQSVGKKSHSFEMGISPVHPQTSRIARTILEHLDRNPPTPKDKLEELKLAVSRKKSSSSNESLLEPNGGQKSALENVDKSNSLFVARGQENVVKAVNSSSDIIPSNVFLSNGGGKISQTKSSHEVPNLPKKPPTSGTKPVLSSISIAKPISNWKSSFDQSTGFTFPVSTSSGALSEPPTPSIMPSSSTSPQQKPKVGLDDPTFTFGSTKAEPSLVFSFPSTSSSGAQNDNPDIKFSFGSDKPRLSFSSLGKNAICY